MTIRAASKDWTEKLELLGSALEDLQWAIIEGKAPNEDHVLVCRYEDRVTELLGLMDEARAALRETQRDASRSTHSQSLTVSLLIRCQALVNKMSRSVFSDLLSSSAWDALRNFEKEGGHRRAAWVRGVRDGLEPLASRIQDLQESFLVCWQEVAENPSLVPLVPGFESRAEPPDANAQAEAQSRNQ